MFSLSIRAEGCRRRLGAALRGSLVVLWLLAVTAGMGIVVSHELAPGTAGPAVERWPEGSGLARAPERPTLVVAAHPHCPCTRATLEELARILARTPREVTTHVLFFRPETASPEWSESDLVERARQIPGVQPVDDPGGREARRFGAETSGHTVVYDASGALRFRGGITASRGHEGDNDGRSAIVALLNGRTVEPVATPVFGCALGGKTR